MAEKQAQSESTTRATYGSEMWDLMVTLKDSSDYRCKQISHLKNFFKSYKKAID